MRQVKKKDRNLAERLDELSIDNFGYGYSDLDKKQKADVRSVYNDEYGWKHKRLKV